MFCINNCSMTDANVCLMNNPEIDKRMVQYFIWNVCKMYDFYESHYDLKTTFVYLFTVNAMLYHIYIAIFCSVAIAETTIFNKTFIFPIK